MLIGRRGIRILVRSVFVLIFTITIALTLLLTTTWGSRQIISIIEVVTDAEISYKNIDGGIANTLSLEDAFYKNGDAEISVKNISLGWEVFGLFQKKIEISSVIISGVRAKLPKSEKKSSKPIDFSGFLNFDKDQLSLLEIGQASVEDVVVIYGNQQYKITALSFDSNISDGVIEFNVSKINALLQSEDNQNSAFDFYTYLKLKPNGKELSLDGSFLWNLNLSGQSYSGNGSINGNIDKINISHHLSSPFVINTMAEAGFNADNKPFFKIYNSWDQIGLDKSSRLDKGVLELKGSSEGLSYSLKSRYKLGELIGGIGLSGFAKGESLIFENINLYADELVKVNLKGAISQTAEGSIDWKINGDTEVLHLKRNVPALKIDKLNGLIKSTGSYKREDKIADVSLSIEKIVLFNKELSTKFNLKYANKEIHLDVVSESLNENNNLITVNADYRIDKKTIKSVINWNKVTLPDLPQLQSSGALNVSGVINDFVFYCNSHIELNEQKFGLSVKGQRKENLMTFDSIDVNDGVNTLFANGNVKFVNNSGVSETEWDFTLLGKDINLGNWNIPFSDGGLKIVANGLINNEAIKTNVRLEQFSGITDGKKINFKGVAGNRFMKKSASQKGYLGQMSLDINGMFCGSKIGFSGNSLYENQIQNIKLMFNVYPFQLENLDSNLKGAVSIYGEIQGDINKPLIKGNLDLKDIIADSATVKKGHVKFSLYPLQKHVNEIIGDFNHIKLGKYNYKGAKIYADGNLQRHELTISLDGDHSLSSKINGVVTADNFWQGEVVDTSFESVISGVWKADSVKVSAGKDNISVYPFCFNGSNEDQICLSASVFPKLIELNVDNLKLSLDRMNSFTAPDMAFQGILNGKSRVVVNRQSWQPQIMQSDFRISKGVAIVGAIKKYQQKIDYSASVSSQLISGEIISKADIKSAQGINSKVAIKITPPFSFKDISESGVRGDIQININDLEYIERITPQLSDIKGNIAINLLLKGKLLTPIVSGNAALSNGGAYIGGAGIKIRDAEISTEFNEDKITVKSQANSGDGKIDITANINNPLKIYPLNISVKGNNFNVVNSDEAKVNVSPELDLLIQQKDIQINGKVKIDRGQISLAELPQNSVTPSSDEIIINDENSTKKTKESYNINAAVEVDIGEHFSFKGFGLKTDIGGKIKVVQKKGVSEGFGQLSLSNGKFKKYGIDLSIEKGQLIFAGPVDNPGLDIRAYRKLNQNDNNERVSVLISGTLKEPVLEFPQESTYGQTDSVSNLLTGKTTDEIRDGGANEGNNNELLYTVGISAGGKYKDKIQEKLGLDSLELSASGWMLGKYLTPDLYISYTMGWLEDDRSLNLRYSLGNLWSLKLNSGKEQAVDILYSIEKN